MARKKVTQTITEELQDIEDKKASEFLEEEVVDGKVTEDPPKETKEEEKPPTETPKEEEPKVDIEKMKADLKEEVAAEVTKETTDKIIQSLSGKESTQDQRDRYQVIADDFLKEHGRNPSWHELIPYIKDDLKADLKAEEETKAKEAEDAKKAQQAANDQYTEAFNKKIDEGLEDLYSQGKLPRIKDKDDPNDIGVKSRQALFKAMLDENEKRREEGKPAVYSIKEIFYEHFTPVDAQPAGADAPISMGRSGTPHNEDTEDYSYSEIHRPKSMMEVIAGAFRGK